MTLDVETIVNTAPSTTEGKALVDVVNAFDVVYKFDPQRKDGVTDETSLCNGLVGIMDSLVGLARAEGKRKVEEGNYTGLSQREMIVPKIENARSELKGERGASESLTSLMPDISALAEDFEVRSHMAELGMPDSAVGRFFYLLQFKDSPRYLSQMRHIKEVEKFVLENAPKWAEQAKAKRGPLLGN